MHTITTIGKAVCLATLAYVSTTSLAIAETGGALEDLSVDGSVLVVGQHLNGVASEPDRRSTQFNTRADIEFDLPLGNLFGGFQRPGTEMELFAHIRAGQGSGLAPAVPTFTGGVNSTTFSRDGSIEGQAHVELAQLWFKAQTHVNGDAQGQGYDHINFTLGKIDPFVFFDGNAVSDDESESFVNNVFVHNPLLDAGGDIGADAYGFSPGMVGEYFWDALGAKNWSVQVGVFGAGEGANNGSPVSDSFSKPFSIAQVRYEGVGKQGYAGVYQAYVWQNPQAESALTGSIQTHVGMGLSLSQQVAEFASVFARLGYQHRGDVNVDRAITTGVVAGGSYWGRPSDRAGMAVGALFASNEYEQANASAHHAEINSELFYSYQVNDTLQISPHITHISHPAALSQTPNITALGLRTKISF